MSDSDNAVRLTLSIGELLDFDADLFMKCLIPYIVDGSISSDMYANDLTDLQKSIHDFYLVEEYLKIIDG